MRAIKIDATNNTLTMVELDKGNAFVKAYKHVGCSMLERMGEVQGHDVYGDEEGRLKGDTRAFMLHGQWVCGNGIVMGHDGKGHDAPCTLTLDEVHASIEWMPYGKVLHTEW